MLSKLFRFCLDAKGEFNDIVAEFDLTFAQWQVLKVINMSDSKELSVNEIVEILNSDKATVSLIVKKLKAKGMLSSRLDENDKRKSLLSLTSMMTSQCMQLKKVEEEFTNNLFSNLSEEEKLILEKLINKL